MQVLEQKGFKNQEEYNDYLDKNDLIICADCEREIHIENITTVMMESGHQFNEVCYDCLSGNYGNCVDCDYWRPKEMIEGLGTGTDELCKFHFNEQEDEC